MCDVQAGVVGPRRGRLGLRLAFGALLALAPGIALLQVQAAPVRKPAPKAAPRPAARRPAKPAAVKPAPKPGAGGLKPFKQTLPESVVTLTMLPIPGGTVKVGEQTVSVKPFWMASTETPWEAFDAFFESGPPSPAYDQTEYPVDAIARPSKSYILPDLQWGHNGYPAINLSHISTVMFCRWLAKGTGKKFRLPTEAEWELAARGGAAVPPKTDAVTLDRIAWYSVNSKGTTHPVGKKAPNAFGLFDMFGNVGEWAHDVEGKPVLCGGAHLDGPELMSPATRKRWSPKWQETDPQLPKSRWWLSDGSFCGFRVVCEP